MLHVSLLAKLWASERFAAHRDVLLSLMVKFGLAMPIRAKPELLVPPLLIFGRAAPPAPTVGPNDLELFLHFGQEQSERPPLFRGEDLQRGFLPVAAFHQLCTAAVSWCYHTTPGFEPSLDHAHAFVRFGRHQLMLTRAEGRPCVRVQLFTDGKGGEASEVLGRLRLMLPDALRHFGKLKCMVLLPLRGYDCLVDFAELKGLMSTGLQASPGRFLSGSEVGGLLNAWLEPSIENTRPHAFISYRWNDCDSPIAHALYDRLSTFDINGTPMVVFLDKERLREGERFDLAFMGAMYRSFLVVPLVSWEALQRMTTLTEASACDNVLLEWSLAVELEKRNGLSVLPVLSGPLEPQLDGSTRMQNLFAARPPKLRDDGRGDALDAVGLPVPDARSVFDRVPKVELLRF